MLRPFYECINMSDRTVVVVTSEIRSPAIIEQHNSIELEEYGQTSSLLLFIGNE